MNISTQWASLCYACWSNELQPIDIVLQPWDDEPKFPPDKQMPSESWKAADLHDGCGGCQRLFKLPETQVMLI
jgi:hypothetical protein